MHTNLMSSILILMLNISTVVSINKTYSEGEYGIIGNIGVNAVFNSMSKCKAAAEKASMCTDDRCEIMNSTMMSQHYYVPYVSKFEVNANRSVAYINTQCIERFKNSLM